MIVLKDLSKRVNHFFTLGPVNIEIKEGSVVGIIGANGSGKSTLLKLISGLILPTKGEILINANKIGVALDVPYYYNGLNLKKNLFIISSKKGVDKNEIDRELEAYSLLHHSKRKFKQLSFGMKKRLELINTFIKDPKLIILDEPTNGLDKEGVALFFNYMKKHIEAGATILLSNHRMEEVDKFCTHILYLEEGRVIDLLPINDFRKKYTDRDIMFNNYVVRSNDQ